MQVCMYVNNHITHTRPSLAAMLLMRAQQNNKKRERESERKRRRWEAAKPDKSNLKRQLSQGYRLLTKCCHVTRSSTMGNLFIFFAAAVSHAIRLLSCCAQRLRQRLRLWLILHLSPLSLLLLLPHTVAFILLLCILILLKARAVASLQN